MLADGSSKQGKKPIACWLSDFLWLSSLGRAAIVAVVRE